MCGSMADIQSVTAEIRRGKKKDRKKKPQGKNIKLHRAATHGCESWTLRKNEETHLEDFDMKGLRKILHISWTAKKINEWVLNKAGVKREVLDTVKARKLAYYGHTMRKQGNCLEKEIMQGTMPGACRRGRPRMA